MKFCNSLLAACLLSISSPAIAYAAANNPPVLTATSSGSGTALTITGVVEDENVSTVTITASGGAITSSSTTVNEDGTYSVTLEVPPFADDVEVKATDEFGKSDVVIIDLQ